MEFLKEILNFLLERKKMWIVPVVFILIIIGVIVFGQGNKFSPFIYTIF